MLVSLLAMTAVAVADPFDAGPNPLLMQQPTTNGRVIVFKFANDLWSVPVAGGSAVRLTNSPGVESKPFFSPDGTRIAFTGQYDGNTDAFVMPAEGGIPKRLTAHPGADLVSGWTPDGSSVAFTSGMSSVLPYPRMFTVSAKGGPPKPLPLPGVMMGSFSPDGQSLAYVPTFKWQDAWKRYRGGQAYSIWIARLSDSKWSAIPKKRENIEQPMWVGDTIYYLSDAKGPVGLNSYDVKTGKVTEVVRGEGFDIKSATAGPDVIVYEKLGSLHLLDLKTRTSTRVPVEIKGDFPEVRPGIKPMAPFLSSAGISPTGQRAVVAARGRIFTVPASKGDPRQLTEGDGIDRREPAWSPDGRTIAYITDERGRQELALLDVAKGEERFMSLGNPPDYYYSPNWSPDSKKIAYTDSRHIVWILDVESGVNTRVDAGVYTDPVITIEPRWSPDSKWITWSRDLDSHMNAVFLYNLDTRKVTQVTDGLANAKSPVFDRDGKHLYFYASTNTGQAISWLDISSLNQTNVTSSLYAVVLSKEGTDPLHPQSDEEPIKEEPKAPAPEAPKPEPPKTDPPKAPEAPKGPVTRIDLENIEHRIIALPMPAQDYTRLEAGPAGSVFARVASPRVLSTEFNPVGSLVKFSFSDRQMMPFAQGVLGFTVNHNGDKLMLMQPGGASIVSAMAPAQPGQGRLALEKLVAKVNPKEEWKRMFHLVWRNEKMLFYDEKMHGIDADVMDKRYAPFLDGIASRADLNYLFTDMLGEMSIGHMWASGGDLPPTKVVPGGLLGADYTFENGRYKIARVFTGERWNPNLRAPLAQPGINAKAGEYVLAINGKELTDAIDIYEALEGKANVQVKVKLGPNADGSSSREVVVVPIANEGALRMRAWGEDNRRRIEEATGGAVGYVHVPDTGEGGWTEFNRYYYSQIGKKGMIIDERFNGGGFINNFMIDEMQKSMDALFTPRHGKDWPTPGAAIFGPKVMLVNEMAGSGGDLFPWLFRERKIGPVIGKRTWGGLVAAFGFSLPDGGNVNSPNCAFYNPNGTWDVEGFGVEPDIEVELDPYLWRQGKDAQLERAIAEVTKLMKTYKYPNPIKPKPADKTKLDVRF